LLNLALSCLILLMVILLNIAKSCKILPTVHLGSTCKIALLDLAKISSCKILSDLASHSC